MRYVPNGFGEKWKKVVFLATEKLLCNNYFISKEIYPHLFLGDTPFCLRWSSDLRRSSESLRWLPGDLMRSSGGRWSLGRLWSSGRESPVRLCSPPRGWSPEGRRGSSELRRCSSRRLCSSGLRWSSIRRWSSGLRGSSILRWSSGLRGSSIRLSSGRRCSSRRWSSDRLLSADDLRWSPDGLRWSTGVLLWSLDSPLGVIWPSWRSGVRRPLPRCSGMSWELRSRSSRRGSVCRSLAPWWSETSNKNNKHKTKEYCRDRQCSLISKRCCHFWLN